MSRRNLHNDENFWPCVSDMFLALFVIALVLYSSMSRDKGKGDEYVANLAAQEACALFETLKREYPDSEMLKSINVEGVRKEESAQRPQLAKALCSLLECDETAKYFYGADENVMKEIPNNSEDYKKAVALLYKARFKDGTGPNEHDPAYHEHMRKVREHVVFEIYKTKSGHGYSDFSHKELVDKIRNLEQKIKDMVEKEKYDALYKKIQNLLAKDPYKWLYKVIVKKSEKIGLQVQSAVASIIQSHNDAVIDDNNDEIKKLEDPRKEVMPLVQGILDAPKYKALRDAHVKVNVDEGVITIPATVFTYPQSVINLYNKGKAVITADLWKQLENKLTAEERKNLKLLAQFMNEIGENIKNRKLAVDNIAIECYMVDTPSLENEGMILQCSFDAWRLLDVYANGELSGYKNADDQGLFSMTGFIREKRDDEKPSGPHMQIRFNCSPKRVEEE